MHLTGKRETACYLITALLLLMLTPVTSTAETESSSDEERKRAREVFIEAVQIKDKGQKIEALSEATKIDPDFAFPYYEVGKLYFGSGKVDMAVESLKMAAGINPDFKNAHYQLGIIYYRQSNYPEAINSLKKALNSDIERMFEREVELAERLNVEAVAGFSLPVYINILNIATADMDLYSHTSLCDSYYRTKKYILAEAECREATRLNRDDYLSHRRLASISINEQRYHEAAASLREAVRIKPDDDDPHLFLGVTYLMMGDNDAALEEYNILKELKSAKAQTLLELIEPN